MKYRKVRNEAYKAGLNDNGRCKWIYPQWRKSLMSPELLGEPFVENMIKLISKERKTRLFLRPMSLATMLLKSTSTFKSRCRALVYKMVKPF